jgi:ATP-dependent exoDNAse (exonuclease V) beta subunit
MYEVPYADPSKGMRKTTLADAKKLGLLPSVTTILNCLDKPALTAWKIENACLSVLTAPRQEGEELDAFVKRVLSKERQQDQESIRAMQLGTEVHEAIEQALGGKQFNPDLTVYVNPVLSLELFKGQNTTEKILVGDGYAGRTDCISELGNVVYLVDFKTAKTLPKKTSWTEHVLQTSAYAAALGNVGNQKIITANIYISTTEPGKIAVFEQESWSETFKAFQAVKQYWYWANGL